MERVIKDAGDIRAALRWSLNDADITVCLLGKRLQAQRRASRNAVCAFFAAAGDAPPKYAVHDPHLRVVLSMLDEAGLQMIVRKKP